MMNHLVNDRWPTGHDTQSPITTAAHWGHPLLGPPGTAQELLDLVGHPATQQSCPPKHHQQPTDATRAGKVMLSRILLSSMAAAPHACCQPLTVLLTVSLTVGLKPQTARLTQPGTFKHHRSRTATSSSWLSASSCRQSTRAWPIHCHLQSN